MFELGVGEYRREKAVEYANYWAYRRNPDYYNFEDIGGDCTNFASQCLYAGTGVMNFTPTYGWYYINLNNRAPAWSSVKYFHQFITTNKGVGPFGREVPIGEVKKGDFVQLVIDKDDFQHTPIITEVGDFPTLQNILVAAHSYDAACRPLSTYKIKEIRFIHIDGFRYLKLFQ